MRAPRLHVITARDCAAAIILRRGPSGQVATIGWDRDSHAFAMGQWLKGRIYEHRSDLSPDGRHFIYFGGTGNPQSPPGGWYTAVSRAPWLHAVAFFAQSDTWFGGGAFTAPGTVWLNGGEGTFDDCVELTAEPDRRAYPHSTDGFHMGDLYAAMMRQRGWQQSEGTTRYDTVLTRPCAGDWRLRLSFEVAAKNRSMISNRYGLVNAATGAMQDCPDWEWAEMRGRHLQFAAQGALHECGVAPDGQIGKPTMIRDFAPMRFEAIRAPYDTRAGSADR